MTQQSKDRGFPSETVEYQKENKGPYNVWIYSMNSTEKPNKKDIISSLSSFKIGKVLCNKYNSINYIKMMSETKAEIDFKDRRIR